MPQEKFVHPYIPNSEPRVKKQLLDSLMMESAEDIYSAIPKHLRFHGEMQLPAPIISEYSLQRHVEELLAQNRNAKINRCFLGWGTWNHHVPAIVDTIIGRDEFLTAYVGDAYTDHGKFQALFESSSMLADLTGFEACNIPTYDWSNAVAIACRMACRTRDRKEILIAESVSPSRLKIVENYCKPDINITKVNFNNSTGLMDLTDLKAKLSDRTTALYFENPVYLGVIENQAREICRAVKSAGALVIVGVDPTSLGILESPASYGVDYAVGELQPLGMHMNYGGGLGGFIFIKDDQEFLGEYSSLLFGICKTSKEGEYGFGEVFYERTSYASREQGKDFIGTTSALFGIGAAVYMALMGPQGFRELGEGILQRVAYAKKKLSQIPGVSIPFPGISYCDFLIDFNNSGQSVTHINKKLLEHDIIGGKNLSNEFSQYGQTALYSITEVHTQTDIDSLIAALKNICSA